jgi:sec-independent protein translocase protein TatB
VRRLGGANGPPASGCLPGRDVARAGGRIAPRGHPAFTMFGIGTPELLVILIVALVVVGPQRLPELGRTIGRALREFRKVQDEVRGMVQTGIGDDFDNVRQQLRGTATELRRTSEEITGGVRQAGDVKSLFPSKKGGPHRTRRASGAPADAMSRETLPSEPDPPPSEQPD